jgi:hypothetical protein
MPADAATAPQVRLALATKRIENNGGWSWHHACCHDRGLCATPRRFVMADLLYLGYTVGFFLLTWAFVKLCERV